MNSTEVVDQIHALLQADEISGADFLMEVSNLIEQSRPRFNGVEIVAQLPRGSEWVMVGKWHGDEYVVFDAWDLNAPSWGQGHYFMQNREGAMAYAVERAGFVRAGQLAEV